MGKLDQLHLRVPLTCSALRPTPVCYLNVDIIQQSILRLSPSYASWPAENSSQELAALRGPFIVRENRDQCPRKGCKSILLDELLQERPAQVKRRIRFFANTDEPVPEIWYDSPLSWPHHCFITYLYSKSRCLFRNSKKNLPNYDHFCELSILSLQSVPDRQDVDPTCSIQEIMIFSLCNDQDLKFLWRNFILYKWSGSGRK